ncbi:MAG TPA: hypothetical protein PKC18_12775 [Lacipirellulaceae bacterium]|nr:hypothetical protein [Lacipirellulaceae bacterium]HMP05844.1 hypothetical protein [Lacipirellulaceae bacterium]
MTGRVTLYRPNGGRRQRCQADHARALLARQPQFRGRVDLFEIAGSDDMLVVRGRVPTFYLKKLVQSILLKMDGVERIENRIDVVNPSVLSSVGRG